MKIMLVDDSKVMRQIQRRTLEKLGFPDIVEAGDGIEALQERVTRQHGFVMQRHRLEIYGLCGQCASGDGR